MVFLLPFLVGIYMGDDDNDDQMLCVVVHKVIRCLCQGLVLQHCCRTTSHLAAGVHYEGTLHKSSYAGCILKLQFV